MHIRFSLCLDCIYTHTIVEELFRHGFMLAKSFSNRAYYVTECVFSLCIMATAVANHHFERHLICDGFYVMMVLYTDQVNSVFYREIPVLPKYNLGIY